MRDRTRVLSQLELGSRRERTLKSLQGSGWSRPRVSPDGSLVVFDQSSGDSVNVWTAPIGEGPPTQLTFDREFMGFANWSPDGKWISFEARRGADTQVYVVPRDGGAATQLTFDAGQSWPHGWSPDGEKIAFAGFRGGVWNLYWVSTRDKTIQQLTRYTSPHIYVRYPEWSRQGDRMAYEYAEITGNIWLLELR